MHNYKAPKFGSFVKIEQFVVGLMIIVNDETSKSDGSDEASQNHQHKFFSSLDHCNFKYSWALRSPNSSN